MNEHVLKIVYCDSHEHSVVFLDGEEVISNDYCNENVIRLAKHLGWKVEIESISRDEFEERYA